jgi:Flp pilus assembly pilin Flp
MTKPAYRRSPITDQQGQTMAEYSVLIGALVLTVVLVLPQFGSSIEGLFSGVIGAFGG